MCVSCNNIESLVERTRARGVRNAHNHERPLTVARRSACSRVRACILGKSDKFATFRTLIAYGLKRDQNVFSFAVMHHLNLTKGNWVLLCPKEARLPNHERGMLGRCGAPVFPSVSTRSSNASHHGCAHFGLPYY